MPKKKEKWILIPAEPTKEMLAGMSNATFLADGSELEMARRFNGMIDNIPKQKRKKKKQEKSEA